MGELLGSLDDQIIIFLQTFSPLLDPIFGLITFFGDKLFVIGILIIIFYCIDKKVAFRAAILVIFTAFVTYSLKGIFALERPYLEYERLNKSGIKGTKDILGQLPTDYTFPSGHSSNAGSFWTFLASRWRHLGFGIVAVVMIIMIPLSRSYLGVHWPTDIIVGVLLGILISLLFIYLLPRIEQITAKSSTLILFLVAIIAPILAVVMSYVFIVLSGHDFGLADTTTYGGLFTGLSLGYMFEERFINLKVKEFRRNKKVLIYRGILGLSIILGLYFSMSAIFEVLFKGFPLEYIARFCRYAILAFAGIFCLPWLFVVIERRLSLEPGAPTE
ncbi:MAG: phosphatase PAP2 family protein [Candidatus Heimdallarchaeota archaeon]|nr:MAG: phosphatase PAP2 family protein [Candidatus Heimdallarchaeota archaeon]